MRAIVALETTIVAHGFPPGEGLAVGRECEQRVRDGGAVPATVAVMDGALHVGLDDEQLERIAAAGSDARKVSPRDLAACIVDGALGATTVGATLAACRLAGIHVMATGGIGGVHRGYETRPDVSADLAELARTPAVVVCSGVKSLLDVPATVEALETLGVPVVGFGTDTVPLFYVAEGGPPAPIRADSAEEVARLAQTHWALGAHDRRRRHEAARTAGGRLGADRGGSARRQRPRGRQARPSLRSSSRTSTSGAAARRSR